MSPVPHAPVTTYRSPLPAPATSSSRVEHSDHQDRPFLARLEVQATNVEELITRFNAEVDLVRDQIDVLTDYYGADRD